MKVAFASCSSIAGQHDYQPIWGIIKAQKPDLLLLLGDNVYISKAGLEPIPPDTTASVLESKYKRQLEEPHFKNLLSKVPYLAIWDNHDFGLPGHKYVPTPTYSSPPLPMYGDEVSQEHREMARGLFNQYLKYESVRPWTKHVYCSYTMNNIKFIMLDVRSRQQNPANGGQLIDSAQKEWLWKEMLESDAEINVICSGLTYTIGGDDTMGWKKYENWFREFNNKAAQTSNPLFIGGNIHNNAFRTHIVTKDPVTSLPGSFYSSIPGDLAGRPLPPGSRYFYEVASSGVGQNFKNPNAPSDEENDGEGDNAEEDKPLADRPRNNYGIIDFTETEVIISLYGQRIDSMHYAKINRSDWTLNGYWRMRRSEPL